jgi:hypothetical protein
VERTRRTLYVLHHAHTDVGYTEPQGRIGRWHADYIRQALTLLESRPEFRWNCETFWAVERFLDEAAPAERRALATAVRDGDVGLSASYLNLSELLDDALLRRSVRRATDYGRSIGVAVDCAMTADINGFGWGFAQALVDDGVENLFTCIHTHHGMFPLGRQQVAFWWETPRGDRLLVWSGEHYHFGNELGLVPGAVSSYLTKDDCDAAMIFSDAWGVAERRIPRYFARLDASGYPYRFAPVMASGLRRDNAPPSAALLDQVERWNAAHGDRYRVELTTLGRFFRRLREENPELPVHRGDWPDWWSDGASGNPGSTRRFRQAQRDLAHYRALAERHSELAGTAVERAEQELILYAEHTFGHADAMSRPWHATVQGIAARKQAYAACAEEAVEELLDGARAGLGGAALRADMPLSYRVVNPLPRTAAGLACLPVGHFELHERGLDRGATAVVLPDDRVVSHQLRQVPGGGDYVVPLRLAAGEERWIELRPGKRDEAPTPAPRIPRAASGLETEHVRLSWTSDGGIAGWEDRRSGRELLCSDRVHGAFTPVHEITPVADRDEICAVRGRMGLNRKGADARRTAGRLQDARIVEDGDVLLVATLDYRLPGADPWTVELAARRDAPRVDVTVRLHKASAWEPENVYLSLPFGSGAPADRLWLDKAGAAVRPRVDQIPGTLTDFYAIQEGFAVVDDDFGVAVCTPDSHLLQLGPLEHGTRRLAGDPRLDDDPTRVYAWLMTNYWETNFAATLGGFHEFRYSVLWGPELCDPPLALQRCRDTNRGLFVVRQARA